MPHLKIKEIFGNKNFSFETISKKDNIQVSVLKESVSVCYEKLNDIFNNYKRSGTCPEILKEAKVTSVFKKGDPT